MRTLKQLIDYCNERGLFVPGSPTKEYLHATIIRATLHESDPVTSPKSCFGFWEHEHPECMLCFYENKCFEASVGMVKESFFRKLKRAGTLRITGRMKKNEIISSSKKTFR